MQNGYYAKLAELLMRWLILEFNLICFLVLIKMWLLEKPLLIRGVIVN